MPIEVDGVVEYLRAGMGGFCLRVGGPDSDAIARGVQAAERRLAAIRHPDEPEEQFASFLRVSDSEIEADFADGEVYDGIPEAVVDAVVAGLEETGVTDARISVGSGDSFPPPQAVVEYGLPEDFPLPDGCTLDDGRNRRPNRRIAEFETSLRLADLLAFFEERLPAAGYGVPAIERFGMWMRSKFHDMTMLRFEGREWRGSVSLSESDAHDVSGGQISLTAVTDVKSALRDDLFDALGRVMSAADLAGAWSEARTDTPDWCYCDQDTLVRKGDDERPRALDAGWPRVFVLEQEPKWLVTVARGFASTAEAAQELGWLVRRDLAVCSTFGSGFRFGPYGLRGNGRWDLEDQGDDFVAAKLTFEMADGRGLHGEKWHIQHDRFVVAVESYASSEVAYEDVRELLPRLRARLGEIAVRFPPL